MTFYTLVIVDGGAKSDKPTKPVIPAKAGIQSWCGFQRHWKFFSACLATFCTFVKTDGVQKVMKPYIRHCE